MHCAFPSHELEVQPAFDTTARVKYTEDSIRNRAVILRYLRYVLFMMFFTIALSAFATGVEATYLQIAGWYPVFLALVSSAFGYIQLALTALVQISAALKGFVVGELYGLWKSDWVELFGVMVSPSPF